MSICITNIYSRLDNVNTSLNIVTESLIPLKQALCMNYADNKLYSTNGKLQKAVEVTTLDTMHHDALYFVYLSWAYYNFQLHFASSPLRRMPMCPPG